MKVKTRLFAFGLVWVSCVCITSLVVADQPSDAGIVWQSDFSQNELNGWEPFGEAGDISKPLSGTCKLDLVDDPESKRKVMKVTYDDSSPTDWFHKGAKFTFAEPISWDDFEFVSCRYKKEPSIISVGYYLRDQDGNWWESFESRDVVTGQWGSSVVKKDSFKLGELSYRKNSKIGAQRSAKLCELFVYFGSISANTATQKD